MNTERLTRALTAEEKSELSVIRRRSFFVQALWNFEKLQNLGWAWVMLPSLRRLYPDEKKRRKVLERHMEFFNTNPFVSGVIFGTVLRQERESVAAGEDAADASRAQRQALMSPLAALGDVFFWATLRPVAALCGAGVFLLGGSNVWSAGAACLTLLAAFNLPQLLARWRGPVLGYSLGPELIAMLRRVDVPGLVAWSHRLGLVLLAAVFAGMGRFTLPQSHVAPVGDNLLYIGSGALMLAALRLKVSLTKIIILLLGLAMLAASLEPFTGMGN